MKTLELTDDHLPQGSPPATGFDTASSFSTGPTLVVVAATPTLHRLGRRLRQIRETAVAALTLPMRLAWYSVAGWRKRALNHTYSDALLTLGIRMYAAGIDAGEIGKEITAVDEQIGRAGASNVLAETLRAEREKRLRQLAECALEDEAPLPGAEAEYRETRKAQAALACHEAAVAALRAGTARMG